MNKGSIAKAKKEAIRFLDAVKLQQLEELRQERQEKQGKLSYVSTPKENGAVKRASMDLTRALADLRRPL